MTRKEAKEILEEVKTMDDSMYQYNKAYLDALNMAIKALEQEPTTKNNLVVDCISRQAVIDAINANCIWENEYNLTSSRIKKAVENLPSVTPQEPRWIPVSEKLPDDRDWYLGIFKEADTGWINPLPFVCAYMGIETMATTKEYWIIRGFSDRIERTDYYFNLECVAWMPLPKPYKAESEAEDGNDS